MSSAPHNQQSAAENYKQRFTVAIKDKPEYQAQITQEIYVVRRCAYVCGGGGFLYESEEFMMITRYFT